MAHASKCNSKKKGQAITELIYSTYRDSGETLPCAFFYSALTKKSPLIGYPEQAGAVGYLRRTLRKAEWNQHQPLSQLKTSCSGKYKLDLRVVIKNDSKNNKEYVLLQ